MEDLIKKYKVHCEVSLIECGAIEPRKNGIGKIQKIKIVGPNGVQHEAYLSSSEEKYDNSYLLHNPQPNMKLWACKTGNAEYPIKFRKIVKPKVPVITADMLTGPVA